MLAQIYKEGILEDCIQIAASGKLYARVELRNPQHLCTLPIVNSSPYHFIHCLNYQFIISMGVGSAVRKIVTIIATILVAVIGVIIIRTVSSDLSDVEYSPENLTNVADGDFSDIVQVKACLLDANRDDEEDSLCVLAYVGVGLTFAVMFTLSILLVRSLNHLCLCSWGAVVIGAARVHTTGRRTP